MRNGIVIGLAVIAVIGVVGYVLLQPREGAVEYHKKEYFRARDGSRIGHAVGAFLGKLGRTVGESSEESQERHKRAERHFSALMRLGYLRERVFMVSNHPAEEVADSLWFTLSKVFTNEVSGWGMGQMSEVGTNTITVIAPADEMAQWEQAIGLADAPKSAK